MASGPVRDSTIHLQDGRALAYCEWGDTNGEPIVALHGNPGSRLWWPDEATTNAVGVHLLTVDRPGYGGSDPLPGRPIAGWADDVAELTESAGIVGFGVVGWSAGAPYAAAVASAMPDRLTGVCVVSSASFTYAAGPTHRDEEDEHIAELIGEFGPAEATVRYAEENREWAEGILQDPLSSVRSWGEAAGDLWLFRDDVLSANSLLGVREALRQGAIGSACDDIALLSPWGFSLEEIETTVDCWHGAQDPGVDLEDFERVIARLPRSTLTVWPDVGHFGLAKYWGSVLEAALGLESDG